MSLSRSKFEIHFGVPGEQTYCHGRLADGRECSWRVSGKTYIYRPSAPSETVTTSCDSPILYVSRQPRGTLPLEQEWHLVQSGTLEESGSHFQCPRTFLCIFTSIRTTSGMQYQQVMENLTPLIKRSRGSPWCSWALMSAYGHQGDRRERLSDVP